MSGKFFEFFLRLSFRETPVCSPELGFRWLGVPLPPDPVEPLEPLEPFESFEPVCLLWNHLNRLEAFCSSSVGGSSGGVWLTA